MRKIASVHLITCRSEFCSWLSRAFPDSTNSCHTMLDSCSAMGNSDKGLHGLCLASLRILWNPALCTHALCHKGGLEKSNIGLLHTCLSCTSFRPCLHIAPVWSALIEVANEVVGDCPSQWPPWHFQLRQIKGDKHAIITISHGTMDGLCSFEAFKPGQDTRSSISVSRP